MNYLLLTDAGEIECIKEVRQVEDLSEWEEFM